MTFADLARSRRMTRSFSDRPLDPDLLDDLLDVARRAPSAGHTQGAEFLVLVGPAETGRYWDATFPADRRAGFAFPGLFRAPALVVVYAHPAAYVDRYAEADKTRTGLGAGADAWAQPMWTIDAAFAAMTLQYAAVDAGLGALFFGVFDHAAAVAETFGVPADREVVGTVALGHPDGGDTRPGRSSGRPRRPLSEVAHRGDWSLRWAHDHDR